MNSMVIEHKPRTPFDIDQNELESMEAIMEKFDSAHTEGTGDFSRGSLIEATVIDYDDRDVYLDLGSKQDGRCSRAEFEEGELPARGSTIQVVVQNASGDGPVRLSKKEADKLVAWEELKEAFQENTRLTGKITQSVNHGFIVEMGGLNLFLPQSQANVKSKGKGGMGPGRKIDFKVLELKEKNRSAIISHRKVIEEISESHWNELLAAHNVGDEVEGEVTKKVSFGIFIKVKGVEGLLHQSDISWKKFAPFKDRFKTGDIVHVKILAMDRESNRLSLGLKQLTEDPWEWATRELREGDVVRGIVTNITDYGAFLEILEGLEGLIHVSELTWSKRVKHPKKYLKIGEEIEAKVLSLDLENKRIALGVKQLQADPWDRILDHVRVGDVLEGTVSSVTRFGAFVQVFEEIEGLIHFNDYSWNDKVDRKSIKKGDTVQFKVLEINTHERRISCGIKQLTESPYEILRKKYNKGDILPCKITGITSFGLFVGIEDGFEGLIHISRIPLEEGQKLEDVFTVGADITAVLLNIDPKEKKIALSIKAFEKKQEQDIISQYIKKDDNPSTSSMGSYFKDLQGNSEK